MIRQAVFSLACADSRKEAPLPPLLAPGLKNGCMASRDVLMGMLRGESSRDKGQRSGQGETGGGDPPAGQDMPGWSANASQDSAGEGANRPRPRLISPRAHNRLRYNATAPTGPRRSGIPEAPGYSHLAVPPPSRRDGGRPWGCEDACGESGPAAGSRRSPEGRCSILDLARPPGRSRSGLPVRTAPISPPQPERRLKSQHSVFQ